jgi:hypothetical protein
VFLIDQSNNVLLINLNLILILINLNLNSLWMNIKNESFFHDFILLCTEVWKKFNNYGDYIQKLVFMHKL